MNSKTDLSVVCVDLNKRKGEKMKKKKNKYDEWGNLIMEEEK